MLLSPNCVKRAQSCISCKDDRKIKIMFSKHCSFDSSSDVINPKLGQKGLKLVFHVPMVIEG